MDLERNPATFTGCRPCALKHGLAYLTRVVAVIDLLIAKTIHNVDRLTTVTVEYFHMCLIGT